MSKAFAKSQIVLFHMIKKENFKPKQNDVLYFSPGKSSNA